MSIVRMPGSRTLSMIWSRTSLGCRRVALHLYGGLPELALESILPQPIPLEDLILDDVCMPPYAGTADHDDMTPLLMLARHFAPNLIVELGTAYGNTVANLCKQVPGCRIITVNAPAARQSGRMTTYSLTDYEIGRVYSKLGYQDRVTQILVNTLDLDLSAITPKPEVGLAIVDACHDTEYVINDFLKITPFMEPGGLVLLHDTHPSLEAHLIGSYTACVRLRRQGFEIAHIENTWWGIWRAP